MSQQTWTVYTEEQITEIDELFKEASFAEESVWRDLADRHKADS